MKAKKRLINPFKHLDNYIYKIYFRKGEVEIKKEITCKNDSSSGISD